MESTDAAPDDSPDESPDEPTLDIQVEPTTAAIIADTSLALLGAVSQIDRLEARQSAWKAEFIDQARRIALMTEEAVITVGKNFSPAQRQDLARRAFVSEVACELRIPERSAIALIDESEALMHRLPLTLAALREGEITYRHAQYLIDETTSLDPDATAQLERNALPFARNLTPARFRQKARTLREKLRPESAVDRREKCSSDRKVEYIAARDGMAWLNLYTTAPVAGALFTSIRTQSVSLQSPAESRSLGQLDADVCADALFDGLMEREGGAEPVETLSRTGTTGNTTRTEPEASPSPKPGSEPGAAFRKIKPNVTVTVPMLSLLGRSDEPATLDGFGPIDIETARKLVGQATSFTRILTDPESGAAVVWGTKRYKPTKSMKKLLRYRDQRCRFPGCSRVAEFCDIDHTIPYGFGGETNLDNLAALCPKHHRMKHDTTWQVEQRGGGKLLWTSPNGRTYLTHPENEARPFTPKAKPPGTGETQTGPSKPKPGAAKKKRAAPASDPPPF